MPVVDADAGAVKLANLGYAEDLSQISSLWNMLYEYTLEVTMRHLPANFAAIAIAILVLAEGGGRIATQAAVPPVSQTATGPASFLMPSVPTQQLTGVGQFGVDGDGNGVPDRLDAFVAKVDGGADTKAAASAYFSLLSKLAAKTMAGEALMEPERQQVFLSLACYFNSAEEDGVVGVDLDVEFMRDGQAFRGMHALMQALNGTGAATSMSKEKMCAAAK